MRIKQQTSISLTNAILEELGGVNAVSRICSLTNPSVSNWKKKGIPKAWVFYLKLKYPKLKAWSLEHDKNRD